jgi:transcriptional regulator with XRE-family HTH domain
MCCGEDNTIHSIVRLWRAEWMEERVFLGQRIKELRKARGLSQETLAEKMDVHPKYLGSVERGEQNPTIEFLEKTAAALKVDVAALFNYPWQKMSEAELKRKLHAMVDKADLEHLREALALMKAREL